jgi:hypothetical protein
LHPYSEEQPQLSLKYLTANQDHWKATTPAGKFERGLLLIAVNVQPNETSGC